jgi:hypothetical protein
MADCEACRECCEDCNGSCANGLIQCKYTHPCCTCEPCLYCIKGSCAESSCFSEACKHLERGQVNLACEQCGKGIVKKINSTSASLLSCCEIKNCWMCIDGTWKICMMICAIPFSTIVIVIFYYLYQILHNAPTLPSMPSFDFPTTWFVSNVTADATNITSAGAAPNITNSFFNSSL